MVWRIARYLFVIAAIVVVGLVLGYWAHDAYLAVWGVLIALGYAVWVPSRALVRRVRG